MIVVGIIAAVLTIASGALWLMRPSGKKEKRITKGVTVAAVMAVIATILLAGNGGTTSAASMVATRTGDPALDLTVKVGDLVPDAARCTNGDTWNRNSQPDTAGRLWTESVSTPFISTDKDKDAQFKELTSEICVNPTLGDAYAQALSDATIGDFHVADANPWLGGFLRQSTTNMRGWQTFKVSAAGSYIMTGTGKDAEKAKFVTADYQSNAELVNTLLYVLENQGTKAATSTVNWPLGALVGDNLPRVHKVIDPKGQENLPFMALTYTLKNGGCPYVLGVNLKDKRPENVGCETAKTIAPPATTQSKPPTITPSHSTPSGTPTKPGNTPSPTPSHSKPPKSCPPGQVGTPPNCLEQKDPTPIPSNSYHTPAASPSGSASLPNHPSETANPSTTPGSGSTQTAPGATSAPKPSASAPPAGNPTSTATACIPDPDTGKGC